MADHVGTYGHIEAGIASWAAGHPDVHGALVVGSRARSDRPADQYSDLDVTLFADDPDGLIDTDDWLGEIGDVKLSFVERTAVGSWRERRAVFAPMRDVDFSVVPAPLLDLDFATPGPVTDLVRPVLDRGFRVLYDPTGRLSTLDDLPVMDQSTWRPPDEVAFTNLVIDFWYHAMWTTKKVLRGELLVARECLDGSMKDKLLHVLDWRARLDQPAADPWHGYRFFESRNAPELVAALHATFGAASARRIVADLKRTMDIFGSLAPPLAARLGFHYPGAAETHVRDWIHGAVPDTL